MGKEYNRSTGYRPRKRKFHGNKKANISINNSASAKKLNLDNTNCSLDGDGKDLTGYRIIDVSILFHALSKQLCCKSCKSDVTFSESNVRGASSAFSIHCDCETDYKVNSCAMVGEKKNAAEINLRIVYAMRCIGVGLQGLQTFSALLNMPPAITRKAYDNINRKILLATQKVAKDSMVSAAAEEVETNGSSDIVVSGDGTWKTRGHSSKIGVCSVIGLETGKVVDVEVLTNYCKGCEKNTLQHLCVKNHTGSAGAMEVSGMKKIFSRSIAERGVRYVKYLGDGDAKTYSEICKSKPYKELAIEKLECIGHVQKRMGSRLRKHKEKMKGIKLPDGKALSGRGRLTDALIDKISVYYGNAIRNNTSSVEDMKTAIWAVYCHLCSNDEEPLHMFCPTGENSWCKYQKHLASGSTAPFHHKNSVPVDVMKSVKRIFADLANPELLKKCLTGKTQNQNESYNSILWRVCPKISCSSKIIAEIAANEAVVTFNDGKLGRKETMKALELEVGHYRNFARKADILRVKTAEKRALMATLESRRAKRQGLDNDVQNDPQEFSLVIALNGPTIDNIVLEATLEGSYDPINGQRISFLAKCVTKSSEWKYGPYHFYQGSAYWFNNGNFVQVNYNVPIQRNTGAKSFFITQWNTSLLSMTGTVRVVFSSGLFSKTVEKSVADILRIGIHVELTAKSEDKPFCLPLEYEDYQTQPSVFVDSDVILQASVFCQPTNKTFEWNISGKRFFTFATDQQHLSTLVHRFKKAGLNQITVIVRYGLRERQSTMSIIAVNPILFNFHYSFRPSYVVGDPISVNILAAITSNRNWNAAITCKTFKISTMLDIQNSNKKLCLQSRTKFTWHFNQPGIFNCLLFVTDGRFILGTRRLLFYIYPEFSNITIKINDTVKTGTPIPAAVVFHQSFGLLEFNVEWTIIHAKYQASSVVFNNESILLQFPYPGKYEIVATISNIYSNAKAKINITALDGIQDLTVEPFQSILYAKVNSSVEFLVRYFKGTNVRCQWIMSYDYIHWYGETVTEIIQKCTIMPTFILLGECEFSLTIYNEVDFIVFPTIWTVFVEDTITSLKVSIPVSANLGSMVTVRAYIPDYSMEVSIDMSVLSSKLNVSFDALTLVYESNFLVQDLGQLWIRIRAYNNVSAVVYRNSVLVIEEINAVSISSIGCQVVGIPARFVVLIRGEIPNADESFLYEWQFDDNFNSTKILTTFPFAESHVLLGTGLLSVTVSVQNDVVERNATIAVHISEEPSQPCLHHKIVAEVGKLMDFNVFGLPLSNKSLDTSLKLIISRHDRSYVISPWRFTNMQAYSSSYRWRYIFYSSGFPHIIGQVFLMNSDFISNLTFTLGIQAQKAPQIVIIRGPKIIPVSRIPLRQQWEANVKPSSAGSVFIWSFQNIQRVSKKSKFTIHDEVSPGIHELTLTVSNNLGHVKTSMLIQAVVTLTALNYTFSDLLVGHGSWLTVLLNQPPDVVFVDFGDGKYDSLYNESAFTFETMQHNVSVFTVFHVFTSPGLHNVYFNVSNSVSSFERWTVASVEEPISGIIVELLSPSVVALLEDVVVRCLVESGTNLDFKWDFGDGTDGLYTAVNSTKNSSLAIHSYGVADTYDVLVHVSNTYETITTYLNVSIQAVEPIEELHLRPRLNQYAAPLYVVKTESPTSNVTYTTDTIVFEAGVWRGSDIQFLFDFGDGQTKLVDSELNFRSLPYANVKYSYSAEGVYDVQVTATNPLDSMNQSLPHPFYVQYPPEGLKLDKQYYIIQYLNNLTIQATITSGTNVSFSWMLNDLLLNETSDAISLFLLKPGIYILTVEASNKVTDFAYKTITRPKAVSKIYVQEKLKGIKICLEIDYEEVCGKNVVELPLDGKISFVAKVSPSTERALRFTWNIGTSELRRSNVPYIEHQYQAAGWYTINVTAQNHISSISSSPLQLHLVQKVANLTSILCQGPNLVNHLNTFHVMYWFGSNLTFQWDFGDGTPLITTHSSFAQHTYTDVGEYWIAVTVWNAFSHDSITTNMFFLHQLCQKPQITFLSEKNRVANLADDVLFEPEILCNCAKNSVKYLWTVKYENGSFVAFHNPTILHQRQLLIPKYYLSAGRYFINIRVAMAEFIVYAEASTAVEIKYSKSILSIEGGYVRHVGYSDSIAVMAKLFDESNGSVMKNELLSFSWSCIPIYQKHLSCFKNDVPMVFQSNETETFVLSASSLNPILNMVIINVTARGKDLMSASQILEIQSVPHTLLININCETCLDHKVNNGDLIKLKASCQNCEDNHLKYKWKIWLIDEGKHHMHFSNYKCVQADGSTFFIVAPNNTLYQATDNETVAQDTLYTEVHRNLIEDDQSLSEELPPFPNLPGFPEEVGLLQVMQHRRIVRNTPDYLEPNEDFSDPSPYLQYPYEGEAQYDDNTTMFNTSYPEFLPYSPHEFDFDDEDYPRPEEGFPGESGSAGARDHGSHRFNEHLTENDIEEGAVPPRVDGQNVFVHEPSIIGDPVRDTNIYHKTPSPHLINRPRTLLSFSNANSTTGSESDYLVLKPGLLKVGSSYLIQVGVSYADNSLEGLAMEYLRVNVGPINGRCTLMPTNGYSLNFNFQLHCFEWKSVHQPLYYELRYSLYKDDPGHLIYYGLNRNAKFVLPAGLATDSFNVYVNVVIKDSLNSTTKVCSLIRRVEPLTINSSLVQWIYNETFHLGSTFTKYLEEKRNQAVLHRIHAYTSSFNHHRITNNSMKSLEDETLVQKLKLRFLEIIDNIDIISKVEAVQILSCLSEMMEKANELSMFEIQKIFNIYKKIRLLKFQLLGDYSLEVLVMNSCIFLSKFAFASHSIPYRNDELVHISRELFISEVQEKLKNRHLSEEPLRFEVPHTVVTALNIANTTKTKHLFLKLKRTSVEMTEDFVKQFESCLRPNCDGKEDCTSLIILEFDYATIPNDSKLAPIPFFKVASVFVALPDCDHLKVADVEETIHLNAHFYRSIDNEVLEKTIIRSNTVFIYKINITEEHLYYSLLFYVRLHLSNGVNLKHSMEVFFRHKSYPTPWKYDWKDTLTPSLVEQSYFIPESYIKDPGVYYFAIWTQEYEASLYPDGAVVELSVNVWKQMCISQHRGYWSHETCRSLKSSNKDWIHCRCTSLEIAGFSVPLKADILQIPAKDLLKSYFNILPLAIFIVILAVYLLLLIFNYRKDTTINLSYSPIPLRDNSDEYKQLYLICIKTGMYFSSGTTASVFVVLHGMNGVTETRQLIGFNPKKVCFQRGATDLFLLSTTESLGPLVKIEVMHNNHGLSPSWYLREVLVKDLDTGYNYIFNCYKWLSAERDDGLIEREIMLSDTASPFSSLLFNNIMTYIHDFNMWNSILCMPPRTFFTGAQRLTCCLCFLLNAAFCFTTLQNLVLSKFEMDLSIIHLSPNTFILCLLVSAMATFPQIVLTILFRFSKPPAVDLNPHFNRWFFSWSVTPFYCWLRHKRSNSSRSSGRSITDTDGSDSLYSSFEESSIMSMSNIIDESFSLDEKQEFSTSLSISEVSDTVSPLQKSISTWQAFEIWVKKKHNIIMNADSTGRQHLYDDKNEQSAENEEILLEEINHFVNESMNDLDDTLTSTYDSLSSGSGSQGLASAYTYSHSTISGENDKDPRLQLLYLPPFFYFTAWLLAIVNATVSFAFILINTSSHTFIKCAFLMKYIFISVLCSCCVWTPLIIRLLYRVIQLNVSELLRGVEYILTIQNHIAMWGQKCFPEAVLYTEAPQRKGTILLVAVMLSLHQYSKQNVCRIPSSKLSKNDETKCSESGYKRMEYFKNYLRPPKEEILEKFRQYALKEKILCSFHCDTWNFIIVFVLILALLLPVNKQMRYHQQSSIHKWLFRSNNSPLETIAPNTKNALTKWLQADFINNIYSEDNLGFTTGCILSDKITLRFFNELKSDDIQTYSCNVSANQTKYQSNFSSECNKRVSHRFHRMYYEKSILVLNSDKINALDQISGFSQFLSNMSSGAISVEFLLFNPSFSFLNFIDVQFEFSERNVLTSESISTLKLVDMSCKAYFIKFLFHLIFLLVMLMKCKNQCWKLFKYRSLYLKNTWNHFTFLFNIVSISYLSYYFIFIMQLKHISGQLKETDLKSRVDITYAVMYESISHNLLAFLIFMHLIKSLELFVYSHRLKNLGKRLFNSWKILLVVIFITIIFLGLCDFVRKTFSGLKNQSHHPLFVCLDAIGSLLGENQKPEVIKETVTFEKCITIIITFTFIAIYTYLFTFVRAVLIRSKSIKPFIQNKPISIKDSGKVLHKKLKEFFQSEKPHIVLKENYILPVEFLLLELEELGEKLLKKADALFTKEGAPLADSFADVQAADDFMQAPSDEAFKLELETDKAVSKLLHNYDVKPLTSSEVDVVKRLNATVPRLSKWGGKKLLPTSLNASLASQRKFKYQDVNLSASLQCRKIRKTYPLQLNSDSSSDTFSSSEKERIPNFTLRKTKSKGKGKSCDLDLNIPDDSTL